MGPPICTRLPPNKDMIKPAIMAVYSPFSGDTPEAMANAMESGMAIIPTIIPATMSLKSCSLVYPSFSTVINFGFSISLNPFNNLSSLNKTITSGVQCKLGIFTKSKYVHILMLIILRWMRQARIHVYGFWLQPEADPPSSRSFLRHRSLRSS